MPQTRTQMVYTYLNCGVFKFIFIYIKKEIDDTLLETQNKQYNQITFDNNDHYNWFSGIVYLV